MAVAAVGEHLHVAVGLGFVAVLQVAAGRQQSAGRDGITQTSLLLPAQCR